MSGFTLDFESMPIRVGGEIAMLNTEPIEATFTVEFDPPIFPPESLMCTGFDHYEITCPPTERQLKRYSRRLRRNKRRSDGTRRKKSHRSYKKPRGVCYQQYMRVKSVGQDGGSANLTMEVL